MNNYRNKIKIQKLETTQDEELNEIEAWQDFYKPKAEIKTLTGDEFWQAQAQEYERVFNIYIRYCKKALEINPAQFRVVYKGNIINIVSVDNVNEENKEIRIKGVLKK